MHTDSFAFVASPNAIALSVCVTEHDPEEDVLGGEAALEETDDELSAPPRKCVPSQPLGAKPVLCITIPFANATISKLLAALGGWSASGTKHI